MKAWVLVFVLFFTCTAMGGTSAQFDKLRLPVAEIEKHATALIAIMKAADVNKDGFIEGTSEWLVLAPALIAKLIEIAQASESAEEEEDQ